MSTTILTDVEIGAIIGRVYQKTHSKEIGELRFKGDVVAIGRAIEQAVLQSEQVQAWKRDAERYGKLVSAWFDDDHSGDFILMNNMPPDVYQSNADIDEDIDAMERQP